MRKIDGDVMAVVNTQYQISVIVPVYNMEKYLRKCVGTICGQTHRNVEIILVDDGSKDDSLKICNELQRMDERIKIVSKENGGVSTARNVGIEKANGKWIMFVDPDDYLEISIIERLLAHVSEETDIVACCCRVFDERGLDDVDHFFCETMSFVGEKKKKLYFQLMQSSYGQLGKTYTAIGVPWGKLYRKEFLLHNDLFFDQKLKRVQDNVFNMYAFFYAREIKYLDEPLYNYRYEHMSGYFKEYRPNYADIFVAVREARYKCLIETGLMDDPEIKKFYLNETAINIVGILKNGVFHKNNTARFDEKVTKADQICERKCFKLVLIDYKTKNIKYFTSIYLVKKRWYRIFLILARLK